MENIVINSDYKNVKSKNEIMNCSKDIHGIQDRNNSNLYHSTIIKLALLTKNLHCSFSIADGDACVSKLNVEGLDTLCTRLGNSCSFKRVDGFADGTYRVIIDCQMIIKANFGVSLANGNKPSSNTNNNILIYKASEVKNEDNPKDLSIKLVKERLLEKQAGKLTNVVQPITPRSPKDSLRLKKKILKNPRGRPKEIGVHSYPTKINLANILPKLAPASSSSMKMVLISNGEPTRNEQFVKGIVRE